MNGKIIKTTTPFSLVIMILMATVSVESQANGDNEYFLSIEHAETLALGGMRGKPPFNRAYINRQNKQKRNNPSRRKLQTVEMSALEINQYETATATPKIVKSKRVFRGGHPDRSKHHSRLY